MRVPTIGETRLYMQHVQLLPRSYSCYYCCTLSFCLLFLWLLALSSNGFTLIELGIPKFFFVNNSYHILYLLFRKQLNPTSSTSTFVILRIEPFCLLYCMGTRQYYKSLLCYLPFAHVKWKWKDSTTPSILLLPSISLVLCWLLSSFRLTLCKTMPIHSLHL